MQLVYMHLCRSDSDYLYRVRGETESSTAERDLRIFINNELNVSQQCAWAARKANHCLVHTKPGIASQSREVIILIYATQVQPHLEYFVQFWVSQ